MSTRRKDKNGLYHDERGRFVGMVDLRDYVERIFEEKEDAANFARQQLETALNEAKVTTEAKLIEAKVSADRVNDVLTHRLDVLESGGAPFASRLDQSLTRLKDDVDTLKANMVRTTVLDALREQTAAESRAQKRQIRNLGWAFVGTLLIAVINMAVLLSLHLP